MNNTDSIASRISDLMANPNPDQFSEVIKTGWLSRIGGSLIGFVVGIILIALSITALSWNEHRAVQAFKALERGLGAVVTVSASSINEKNDQRLVYLTGPLSSAKSAFDPAMNFAVKNAIRLQRDVAMYQWVEQITEKTTNLVGGSQTTEKVYEYVQAWVSIPQNSKQFKIPAGHQNPPMPLRSETFNATSITLGAFALDPAFVEKIDTFESALDADKPPAGYQRFSDAFYRSRDPSQPEIGDLRITYQAAIAKDYSIVAKQSNGALAPYKDQSGYVIALLEAGQISAANLFAQQGQTETALTWMGRILGLLFIFLGLRLLFGPIEMLAAVLPFLQSIVGFSAGVVAFLLALPITLVTIAIAWLYVRPAIGIGLVLLSVFTVFTLRKLLQNKTT
jgi:hypothetical protein